MFQCLRTVRIQKLVNSKGIQGEVEDLRETGGGRFGGETRPREQVGPVGVEEGGEGKAVAPGSGEVADVYPDVVLENDLVQLIQDSRQIQQHREDFFNTEEIIGLA